MAHESNKEKAEKTRALAPRRPTELQPSRGREFTDMDRLFDRMVEDLWRRPFPNLFFPERLWRGTSIVKSPTLDVYEEKDEVVVKAELPGMKKEDVEIKLADRTLTLKGEKKQEEEVKEDDYWCRERAYGHFTRSIELPADVKADQITASFRDGVLEVRMPKTEEAKKKTINIPIQ